MNLRKKEIIIKKVLAEITNIHNSQCKNSGVKYVTIVIIRIIIIIIIITVIIIIIIITIIIVIIIIVQTII